VKVALTALAVLVAMAVGGEPRPDRLIDWERVEDRIQARWPGVISVEHDPVDDFVVVLVPDGTSVTVAAEASCATIFPVMHEAGSRALFAVYTEGGAIISSWNRCPFSRPTDGS
jgi:hypothetical protein